MNLSDYRLFTDENIDPVVVAFLREQGFDVCDVKENNWFGRKDIDLMALAHQDQRVIITHDSDFGTLVFTRREPFTGLIYLRPGHFDAEPHIQSLKAVISSSLDLATPFILIAENTGLTVKIRLRQL